MCYNIQAMTKAIAELKGKKVSWVNVTKTGKEELATLKRRFGFFDFDLKDCPPPIQRPKLVERPGYFFMILLFPVYDRTTRKIRPVEVDFFIKRNLIVTVHEKLPAMESIFAEATKNRGERDKLLGGSSAELLTKILDELLDTCFPMLLHIAHEVDAVEDHMTEVRERQTIGEIFRVKTNIVNFKRCIQPHKEVLRKLAKQAPDLLETKNLENLFARLVDHTKEIWDALESSADALTAIEDTHLSLLNFYTNDTIRVLTIFAVIVFPLSLVAGIFGMNTVNAPFIGGDYDFWVVMGLMAVGGLGMLAYFKWKKWL